MLLETKSKFGELLTPEICVKKKFKKITVSGRSKMTDPEEFYSLLIQDIEQYFALFNKTLYIEFDYEYINTGSTKWLYFVISRLESLITDGGSIKVIWKFEEDDEAIEETGEVLKSLSKVPFRMTSYQ